LITANPDRPLLSILVVNYNGSAHLEECLSSLFTQDCRDFEVVLVDNASVDGSADFVRRRFPEVRLVEAESNLGFAGGNNLGLRYCRGDFVFFLNNDTRLEPGALAGIAEAIRAFPEYRIFACLMLKYRDPSLVDNAGETLYLSGHLLGFAGYPARLFRERREVAAACGGAAVYARPLLETLGGFEEKFFLLFEDLDLALRSRHLGERVLFLPEARVLHKGSASIGGAGGRLGVYYGTRNYFPMLLRNFPAVTLIKCSPGIAYGLCARLAQVLRHGGLRHFARGLRDAWRLTPWAWRARRRILGNSRLDRRAFESLFRPAWLRERIAFKKGDFRGIP
jgi:GT2 family glycosyltransferase